MHKSYEARLVQQREYKRRKRQDPEYLKEERKKARERRASPKGKKYQKQYRLRNRKRLYTYHTEYIKRRRVAGNDPRLELVSQARKLGCLLCPEKTECCLSFHHFNPQAGDISVIMASHRSIKAVIRELKKCVCLCENCHRKVHAGVVALPEGFQDAYICIEGSGKQGGGIPGPCGEGVEVGEAVHREGQPVQS